MTKIIFLDVDGELTYCNYRNSETSNIDIEKVKLLKEICDRTGAKVVISSSWRGTEEHTLQCYHILVNILAQNDIEVIGNTPHIKAEFIEEVPKIFCLDTPPHLTHKYRTGRAAEIQKWLSEHDVDAFVILDDEDYSWSDYGYDQYWVQPTYYDIDGGLQREHVEKVVSILNNITKE